MSFVRPACIGTSMENSSDKIFLWDRETLFMKVHVAHQKPGQVFFKSLKRVKNEKLSNCFYIDQKCKKMYVVKKSHFLIYF